MTYLASPYSHVTQEKRILRFIQARSAVIRLAKQGTIVFSPIVYSHQLAQYIGVIFEPWREFDLAIIDAASELWVLTLDGWRESVGVTAEIEYATSLGKPVRYIDHVTLAISDTRPDSQNP